MRIIRPARRATAGRPGSAPPGCATASAGSASVSMLGSALSAKAGMMGRGRACAASRARPMTGARPRISAEYHMADAERREHGPGIRRRTIAFASAMTTGAFHLLAPAASCPCSSPSCWARSTTICSRTRWCCSSSTSIYQQRAGGNLVQRARHRRCSSCPSSCSRRLSGQLADARDKAKIIRIVKTVRDRDHAGRRGRPADGAWQGICVALASPSR